MICKFCGIDPIDKIVILEELNGGLCEECEKQIKLGDCPKCPRLLAEVNELKGTIAQQWGKIVELNEELEILNCKNGEESEFRRN